MLTRSKKTLSLIILLIGLALVARTVWAAGTITYSAGMICGSAFALYGAVKLYYLKGAS